ASESEIIQQREVFAGVQLADSDRTIAREDRIAVAFVDITDLERALRNSTWPQFERALLANTTEEFIGYHLNSVVNQLNRNSEVVGEIEPFPYSEKIPEVMGWWGEFDASSQ
ncbi:hypothetical protein, partial [Roseibium sediminis]|uniref:hypothetical protein n=1 Tax=Roseibium sediminis TaxID=1775174 RepID=UPI001375BAAE